MLGRPGALDLNLKSALRRNETSSLPHEMWTTMDSIPPHLSDL